MAYVELVIKLPEEIYSEAIKSGYSHLYDEDVANVVGNGILLPKGHGRIADMDEAIKCIEEVEGEDAIWAINLIEWACSKRTIIEADKESEE